jgi:HTH-type transcriptional regulator, sugar sensing transcriptional regulator
MLQTVRPTLKSIGLTEGEIDVYLALLEIGLSTTGKITKVAGISSSKVYEVLQRLIKKGLANYVVERGVHYYSATPAERLIDFLEDKKNELNKGQDAVRSLIPILEAKRSEQPTTEAVIYRGRQGPLIALKEVYEAGLNGAEIIGYGTDDDGYVTHYPAQLTDFITNQNKKKLKSRLIFGEGFKSPNNVYGNKVAIVDMNDPFTTIIIEKKEIADSYRKHFEVLWKMAHE